jgi:hypothetical protein
MENEYRLKLSVGGNEFEASGSAEQVQHLFEEWKRLLEKFGGNSAVRTEYAPPSQKAAAQLGQAAVDRFFEFDEKRKLVQLRVIPRGDRVEADALLLAVYGYRRVRGQDEVAVTTLKSSLQASGVAPDRIDRAAQKYVGDQLLLKRGRGKGGLYSLSNRGVARAEEIISSLISEVGV